MLRPDEITQCAQLAEESQAATNSHLLDILAAIEIAAAGKMSGQRKARERKENMVCGRLLGEPESGSETIGVTHKYPRTM